MEWAAQELEDIAAVDWVAGEIRSSPSSAVVEFRATGHASWWLKINHSWSRWEPKVLGVLASAGHALVPDSIIAGPGRPWSLIKDAGVAIGDARWMSTTAIATILCDFVQQYATLQQLIPTEIILETGTPDFSPERISEWYERLVADVRWTQPGVTSSSDTKILSALRCGERIGEMASELAAGVAPCLQHDDVHHGNIFIDNAALRLIDWGDAVISHPFCSIGELIWSLGVAWDIECDDPIVHRIVDSYLEVWTGMGWTRRELRRQMSLAYTIDCVIRAHACIRAVGSDLSYARDHGVEGAPSEWLVKVVDDASWINNCESFKEG